MSDGLDKFIAEQRAKSPEFAKAYDEGKALEERARKIAAYLTENGWDVGWIVTLAILEADRDLDNPST